MNRPRILVVGSLVMDLIVQSDRFVRDGETILGSTFCMASGGKGANQAVQAARLGAQVTMVGCVGEDDFGDKMIASLHEAGVDVSHIRKTRHVSSAVGNVQISANAAGTQNRIVVIPGANMALCKEDIAFLKVEMSNYDMLMLQLEIPMEVNLESACIARVAGVPVMLNPAPAAQLSESLLRNVTYLSPNENEAALLSGIEAGDEAGVRSASGKLFMAGADNVIITRGEAGSALRNSRGITFCPCVRCDDTKDPTAAGDSFVAAFCVGVCSGLEAKDALLFAAYAASITVSRMGAQPSLPRLDEVVEKMRNASNPLANFFGKADKTK